MCLCVTDKMQTSMKAAWHLTQHASKTHRPGAAMLSALATSVLSARNRCLCIVPRICQPSLLHFVWLVHETISVQFLAFQAIATLGAVPHLARMLDSNNEVIAEGTLETMLHNVTTSEGEFH